MRLLALITTLAMLSGCLASAQTPIAPASSPTAGAQGSHTSLYHESGFTFDRPPHVNNEVEKTFTVPPGLAALRINVNWTSATPMALGGAEVKVKDPSKAKRGESEFGTPAAPKDLAVVVDAPAAGEWVVEYEGFAPALRAAVDITGESP